MNRRGFLGMLCGGVALAAAERTWPFRVFSFPTELKGYHFDKILADDLVPSILYDFETLLPPRLGMIWYDPQALDNLKNFPFFAEPR